jgi:hypothetical protein
MNTLTFDDVLLAASSFHSQHNLLHPEAKLDVVSAQYGAAHRYLQLHDALHWYLQLSTADEDLIGCIESRLDAGCTHLHYLKEYTDSLPAGFLQLWASAKSDQMATICL